MKRVGNKIDNDNIRLLPDKKIKEIKFDEVFNEIKYKTKLRKAPGFDWIAGIIVKQLLAIAIRKLVSLYNAVIKLQHVPLQWKKAEIIVNLKSGKPSAEPSSYRPISLLPVLGKIFEKIRIKRLLKIANKKGLIINEQFGFRAKHSTTEQLHRITSFIEKTLERKHFCNGVFLDVASPRHSIK